MECAYHMLIQINKIRSQHSGIGTSNSMSPAVIASSTVNDFETIPQRTIVFDYFTLKRLVKLYFLRISLRFSKPFKIVRSALLLVFLKMTCNIHEIVSSHCSYTVLIPVKFGIFIIFRIFLSTKKFWLHNQQKPKCRQS